MSHSYKKNPIRKMAGSTSFKTIFNRRFRRKKDLDFPSGNAYRKTNETWAISDISYGYFAGEKLPDEPRKYWYAMK